MPDRQPTPATVESLRASHLFDGLHEPVLERLARELPTELAQPGQRVIIEGELSSHMYLVLSGEVEVLHKGDGDHDVRVALLGPGDWVGEMALLEVRPRSASVRALAPSNLLRISATDAKRVLHQGTDPEQFSQLVINIARELSRRLRVADSIIAHAAGAVAQRYVMESRRPPPP